MANYKIHDIPFTTLYLSNGSANPNLDTLNNGRFKGLSTNFLSSTYLIERPFQNFFYLNNGADISPYFFAKVVDYTTAGSFSTPTSATPTVRYKHANFMIIGGGGGGGASGGGSTNPSSFDNSDPGGSGGHGQFRAVFCYPLLNITQLSGSIGNGGAGGIGVFKANGNPGDPGGTSTITNILSSSGGNGGGGGNRANNPGTPVNGSGYSNIEFFLYGNNPTNPLIIYQTPPTTIPVNSTFSSSNLASSVNTGNGGPGGLFTSNSNDQAVFPSTGRTGTPGNPGRVVIYWLYDPRQRIDRPTIWVDAYSGTTTNYGKTNWSSGLTLYGSGLNGYYSNGLSNPLPNTLIPTIYAYVAVYTIHSDPQFMGLMGQQNLNFIFFSNGTIYANGNQLNGNPSSTIYVNGAGNSYTKDTIQLVVVTMQTPISILNYPYIQIGRGDNSSPGNTETGNFLYTNNGNKIHEFMLFDYDINATTNGLPSRQYIEGHLAAKWGITLPNNHPFYGKSNILYFE